MRPARLLGRALPTSRAGAEARPPWRLVLALLLILATRLAAAALIPLTEDEAYYRLWARAPAFGYVDHPPMIAWWTAFGMWIGGDTPFGVRLLPSIASFLTSLAVFDIARSSGARRDTATWAAVLFNATLLLAFGGFLAVPDAPAALFWSLALCCILRAEARRSLGWWAGAGLSAGLATISKYSALFLGPGVLLWLFSSRERRTSLATAGPWLALLLAALVFASNIAWNAMHGWLTFEKQFGRVAPRGLTWHFLPELLLGQALLLNPIVTGFLLSGRWRRAGARIGLLVATTAPFAAYLLIHSLHDRVQAHWPAPLYPAAAILAALAAERSAAWLRWAAPAVTLAAVAGTAALAGAPVSIFAHATDPFLPLRGWSAFSDRLESDRRAAGAAWVGTSSYGLAAVLAAEHQPASLWQISERDRWRGPSPGALPDLRRPGIVVDLPRRVDARKLSSCFREVRPLGLIARGDAGEKPKLYAVFAVAAPIRDVLNTGCW